MKRWQLIALMIGLIVAAVIIDVAMVALKGAVLLDVAKAVVA